MFTLTLVDQLFRFTDEHKYIRRFVDRMREWYENAERCGGKIGRIHILNDVIGFTEKEGQMWNNGKKRNQMIRIEHMCLIWVKTGQRQALRGYCKQFHFIELNEI